MSENENNEDDYTEHDPEVPLEVLFDDSSNGLKINMAVHRGEGGTAIECVVTLPNGRVQEKTHQAPFSMDDRELRKIIRNTVNWAIRVCNGKH